MSASPGTLVSCRPIRTLRLGLGTISKWGVRIKRQDMENYFDKFQAYADATTIHTLTGSPVTPLDFDIQMDRRMAATPVRYHFYADLSQNGGGLRLAHQVCCGSYVQYSGITGDGGAKYLERNSGVLLGQHDVVHDYFAALAANGPYYEWGINLAFWGEGANADFDVYARCNYSPTPTVYDYASRGGGSDEFIQLPGGECLNGRWYVAFHSYAGSGHFNYVVSPIVRKFVYSGISIDIYEKTLKVGIRYPVGNPSTELTGIRDALSLAAKRFYGLTEGQYLIRNYQIWRNVAQCDTGCGGAKCDICFENLSGPSCWCNGFISIKNDIRYRADGIAHEFGHGLIGLGDEYTLAPNGSAIWLCGHSYMASPWTNNHNFCWWRDKFNYDHGWDGTPGSSIGNRPCAWEALRSVFPLIPDTTPDNHNYETHNFNGVYATTTIKN